jgi:hypothetical protein
VQKALKENWEKIGPIVRANPKLGMTGPHHVGAEIDLEFQASYNAAWRTYAKGFLAGMAGSFGAALLLQGKRGEGTALFAAGFCGAAAILSEAMSKTVASRALTETHPALKPIVGKTGGWEPVDSKDLGPTTLPDGQALDPDKLRSTPKAAKVTFQRYGK